MNIKFGFFIREEKYISDLPGLLKYLAEKINIGLMCIYCDNKNTKGFSTAEAVKQHMIDKAHCFMSEDFDECEKFYDFREALNSIQESKPNDEADEEEDSGSEWEDMSDQEEQQAPQPAKEEAKPEKLERISLKEYRAALKRAQLLTNGEIKLPGGRMYNFN